MASYIDYESRRLVLEWVAGHRGTPTLNNDTENFAADPFFEVLGTDAAGSKVTFATDGGILLATDADDGDGLFILPHLDTEHAIWDDVTWGTDDEVEWECLLKLDDVDSTIAWAGLKLTNADAVDTDDDQAYFRYEDDVSSAVWVAQISVNDDNQSHVSDNKAIANELMHFAVKFDKDEMCHMFINGREVYSRSFRGNTVNLKPYIAVEADGAADIAKLTVYGQKISRILK